MSFYPDSPEEWSAIAGTIMALLIVWKKYRSERKSQMETCPAHMNLTDRMDKSEKDRGQMKDTLNHHGKQIAVTVALLKELKNDVVENRRLVADKLDQISDQVRDLAIGVAMQGGGRT